MDSLEEMRDVIQKQEEDLRGLREELAVKEQTLCNRDQEIQRLKSQLDQYQSVLLPASGGGFLSLSVNGRRHQRLQRLQGISAEPQSLRSLQEFIDTQFPEYPKSEQ